MQTNLIETEVSLNLFSLRIPLEDPPEEEDEEDEAKEKDATVKTSPASDTDPQLVEEKKSSGCLLCNLL